MYSIRNKKLNQNNYFNFQRTSSKRRNDWMRGGVTGCSCTQTRRAHAMNSATFHKHNHPYMVAVIYCSCRDGFVKCSHLHYVVLIDALCQQVILCQWTLLVSGFINHLYVCTMQGVNINRQGEIKSFGKIIFNQIQLLQYHAFKNWENVCLSICLNFSSFQNI